MRRVFIVIIVVIVILVALPRTGSSQEHGGRAESLVIGLTPEQNIFKQIERYTPLAEYLSQKCQFRVKLKVATSYGEAINDLASSEMDGAFLGALAYVLACRKVDLEPLVRPEGLDGTSMYHGLLFVRRKSGIKSARQMRGRRFAFVDRATVAGFLLPLVYFHDHGIKDYKTYFKETYFAGTHEDAILDVLDGRADIAAAKSTVFHRMAEKDKRIGRELMILSRSPDMPEGTLALRKDLDPSMKAAIRDALLKMDADPVGRAVLKAFGAERFVPTVDRDYEPLVEYAHRIKLDLQHYTYE
jgi:phosphonate transport system substrate-binding protein